MESQTNSNIGIQSKGDAINWRMLNEERVSDDTISALVEQSTRLFITNEPEKTVSIDIKVLNIFIETFNKFLKDSRFKFTFTISAIAPPAKSAKKPSQKELIIEKNKADKIKKHMDDFIISLKITNHLPFISSEPINAFFNVLFWGIYLLSNKKASIDLSIYLNCSISLYRCINDSRYFLPQQLIEESYNILNLLEEFLNSKIELIFKFISSNFKFIIDSLWDICKPNSISLYEEQIDIISLVTNNLNLKKLIFFEMPPANGKTVLSAILAKIIAHRNKKNLLTIPSYKRKSLLYICYNTIVRNEVAKLCITHNVDCRYWLAVTKVDKMDAKIKTFLNPYKNCYPDWNKQSLRNAKENAKYRETKWMKFSENIHDQWNFYIKDTLPISEQLKDPTINFDNPENLPEMIISDLDSAYVLLKEFPDTFITYFDEAFAASELEITSKIMSVLGHSILVSATLAKPEEIPTVINDFKRRHNYRVTDNSCLHVIKSTKQHISCTFIDPTGNIFAPHNIVQTIEELAQFNDKLNIPLIQRAYSPEVVFNMSEAVDTYLPEHLKFRNLFRHFGSLTHEGLRNYACNILKYISESNNNELFEILKLPVYNKIANMDVNLMFTRNAIFYNGNETLHVATSNNFDQHVESISNALLKDSPKLSNVTSLYEKETKILQSKLESCEKVPSKKDSASTEPDNDDVKISLSTDLSNLRLKWPHEFLVNSAIHASMHKNYSASALYNTGIHGTIQELDLLDETRAKLFLSKIGIYQPESFNKDQMELFLRNKDRFKFIISTPSIVYGTNISLSIIDIDESFIADANKNRLYQLIGRAGRKGKSFSATIIFRHPELIRIILDNNNENDEAIQVEQNYQRLLLQQP